MKKKFLTPILALFFLITSVLAYPFTETFQSTLVNGIIPSSVQIGNQIFSLTSLNFNCQYQKTGQVSYTSPYPPARFAPQGAILQQCTCTQTSQEQSTYGQCFKDSCTNTIDNQSDPSCWVAIIGNNKFNYNTPIQPLPYVTMSYTTNAIEEPYLDLNNKQQVGVYPVYNLILKTDIDVSSGLALDVQLPQITSQSNIVTINYNNQIADQLQGYIEVKQATFLFLPASTIAQIPITFSKGQNSITWQSNSILGNTDYYITPVIYVYITNPDGSKSTIPFAGAQITRSTKVVQQQSTAGTIPYNPQGGSYQVGTFQSFWCWLTGIFGVKC